MMNPSMLQAMLWKEWRETRWKWLLFGAVFHVPALFGILLFLFSQSARFRMMDMAGPDALTILHYYLLAHCGFVSTVGIFLIAFFAGGVVAPEMVARHIFFLFERPVYRWQLLLIKSAVGVVQLLLWIGISILVTVSLVYGGFLLVAPQITVANSWGMYTQMTAGGFRAFIWLGFIGILAFTGTLLLSILFERWWVGVIVGAFSLIGVLFFFGLQLLQWFMFDMSEGVDVDFFLNPARFARLAPGSLLTMALSSAALYLAAQYLFARKELK